MSNTKTQLKQSSRHRGGTAVKIGAGVPQVDDRTSIILSAKNLLKSSAVKDVLKAVVVKFRSLPTKVMFVSVQLEDDNSELVHARLT